MKEEEIVQKAKKEKERAKWLIRRKQVRARSAERKDLETEQTILSSTSKNFFVERQGK